MRHLIRTLATTLLFMALPASAGLRPDDKLESGDGAVVVTVTVDFPSFANANAMPGLIPDLTVERLGTGAKPERFILPHRLDGLQSTRAYAGSLPPGRYRIHDLMGGDCRLWCGDGGLSVPKAGDLPDFVVEAGKLRFLGNVLVSVMAPVPPSKKWTVAWAYSDAPDPAVGQRLLLQVYPQLASVAPGEALLGWEPTEGGAAAAAAARERIRRRISGLNGPNPYGPDGFVFGAQHGVIKRWNRVDGLRLIDTGSTFLIRTVLSGSQGQLLAGGEASTLLYSGDDGRTWKDVSADLPYGIVLQIKPLGGDELVFALQHGANAALYRGKLGENQWTRVGEWPMEFATWTGLPGAQPQMEVQGRQVALTLPSKKGVFVDLDSGESHAMNPPGSLANFTFTADGVMRCTCFRSIAANPWESRDLGKTWGDSPLDRWMVLPAFRDAEHGFSYKGAMFSAKKTGVMRTSDGGKTWTQSPSPGSPGAWRPSYSADGSVMLLSGIAYVDREVVEQAHWSADDGATWSAWAPEGAWLHPVAATP